MYFEIWSQALVEIQHLLLLYVGTPYRLFERG